MTKRIIGILVAILMVMALIPMSAFAKAATRAGNAPAVSRDKTIPTRDAVVSWDFEGDLEGWTNVDADGDGYVWTLASVLMAGYIIPAYSGEDCVSSQSYDGDAGPLTPDNWLVSPAVQMETLEDCSLSLWYCAQDASYAAEHFRVYAGVSADTSAMVPISDEITVTASKDSGAWLQLICDLTDVELDGFNGTIYFAVRHFNCSDMFYLNVDLIEVIPESDVPQPTEEPEPTEPPATPAEGNTIVILNVPTDHWEDGSGYQMLIDADATAYGTIIPESGGLTESGGASAEVYAEFEYKIPENADGALDTANIVSCTSVAIEIPAGVYDWCITNPTPNDRVWIASANGNVPGRYDNYVFEPNMIYEFTVTLLGTNDAVNVTITSAIPTLNDALNVEGGSLNFETGEDYPWETFEDGDRLAAWSTNKGQSSTTSYVTTTVYALAGDTIAFDFMAWGEGSSSFWDKCEFIVNGETVKEWGAYQNNDWEGYIHEFEEDGTYTLTWSYSKDTSVNPTGDYFAVDEVEFTTSFDPLDAALNKQGGSLHFETEGDYPWITATEGDRNYAMSGNAGVHSSTSTLTLNVEGFEGDTLVFDYKAWGESSSYGTIYDKCQFIVNGEVEETWGAEDNDWTNYTYILPYDGAYVFTWSYTKDSSVSATGDYFAVDEVEFNTTGEPNLIISEIDVEGFSAPMPGTTPADYAEYGVPAHAHYSVENVEWWDEETQDYMAADAEFVEGNMYSVRFTVVPEEGYSYISEVDGYLDMYINGGADMVDYENSERFDAYTAYVWSKPVECGVSELDMALNIEGGKIHFESEGTYPWVVVNADGRMYAKSSNEGASSSASVVTATVVANEGDVCMFDFKAWGEGTSTFWDKCEFIVNGTTVKSWGKYDNDWEGYVYFFPSAGTYTLTWSYSKDSSVDPEGDYFAVDNVFVGEPAHVEEITCEPLDIPMNRGANIVYTVLPENAVNKNVTFTSADPSIATVDSNGYVFGVAEGEVDVTIASVDNPEVTAICRVTVTDTGLTAAQIYGMATYDFDGALDNNWITFTDVMPGNVSSIGASPEAFAAAYAYGTVFVYTQTGGFGTASFDDITNLNVTEGVYTAGTLTSMTFDYTRGCLFAVSAGEEDSMLVLVDPSSGEVEEIGLLDQHIFGLCVDEEGNGYGVDNSGNFYSVDLDTAEMTVIGNTGVSCGYVQDICYDFNTGDIYWAQIESETAHGLYRINKNDGSAEELGTIGAEGMEVVGMFIIPNEEPEAGDASVESITIRPEEVEIRVGEEFQFSCTIKPFNASNKDVEWTVDDEDVLAVDPDGRIVGLMEGVATVTVTSMENPEISASAIVTVLPSMGEIIEGYFFEEEAEVNEWTFVDKDGDGYNWMWNIATGWNLTPYEGSGIICSESYHNSETGSGGTALNPDNWAISPAIELPAGTATVTLYAAGQDADWASEVFAIYAGTTADPDEMTAVSEDFTATGEYIQYTADLSDFAGQTVYIAIRHYNVTDMFILNVDQVEIWSNEGDEPGEPIWGDANGDGEVTSADVLLVMRYAQGLDDIDEENLPWVDVNGDGVVNMADALLIARYNMGIIDHFPVEEVEEPLD
ncbi:MAG: DUF2436 domain-containing protein [Clostridiales bacterium]|nr:DUF2436 domain-containing protein [Clostridiales bacterium]